ncbi:hypothetical protein GQ43DRAFT_456570 [Delitschia confertaspora ATCC 74209]|uniref:TFIIH C1-like domain-containing protein n=1 Tax=Delitschia confertaspora ATCC 74209 TaxID=1513339 RepID=A0A9P4JNT4_9PLEO|nr:hypothetical protein GQ43DRAFT_456570 [Delitschia confertaspora ATCC 74209]
MADSDDDFIHDSSDDEYRGQKSNYGTRAQEPSKKRTQQKGRKLQAWETAAPLTGVETYEEAEDGTIQQSVHEKAEERKRKRLRRDTKPFQRGIIRHVALVLDVSEAMLEKDMRPNRYITMIKYTQEYVREFFEQNPISQMTVLIMRDGLCTTGNIIPHSQPRDPRGHYSLWGSSNPRSWRYPSDHQELCKGPCSREHHWNQTNGGDESEYVVATDQESLRELLLATTTPPVVRTTQSSHSRENVAALMAMGFPSRVIDDVPTLCACHGNLTRSGYTCSRCKAKVCSLPSTCPSCQLTLLLSTHLARSYHHLFPLQNWRQVSWERARKKRTQECASCLTKFPEPPPKEAAHEKEKGRQKDQGNLELAQNQVNGDSGELRTEEYQKASESSRYECASCGNHFCIDCDIYCHTELYNCPGCLSQADLNPEAQRDQEAEDGKTYYGNLAEEIPTQKIEGHKVEVLSGDITKGFSKTGEQSVVKKLLCPLPSTPIIECIGLNYKEHATECNLTIPTYPTVFTKLPDSLTGPLDTVPIHPDCTSQLDYEGELTVVIGKDCKNVSEADALSYILGYTVGNDVSARNFQLPANVSGGQFGYAKSFDKFAPIGPAIVSPRLIPDPQKLKYTTKVNGEIRQQTGTDDMIWTVAQIIAHLSRGTTLRAGTVIMTGTPSGVGLFSKPPKFVTDGDVVKIEVEGIGAIINKMQFE